MFLETLTSHIAHPTRVVASLAGHELLWQSVQVRVLALEVEIVHVLRRWHGKEQPLHEGQPRHWKRQGRQRAWCAALLAIPFEAGRGRENLIEERADAVMFGRKPRAQVAANIAFDIAAREQHRMRIAHQVIHQPAQVAACFTLLPAA